MANKSATRVVRLIPVLDFGGVESILCLQSELIDKQTHDFRVCTFWKKGDAARRIEATGVVVDDLGVDPSIRNPRATLALYRYLRKVRPDVVHSSIGEANFHASLVSKLAGVKATIIEEQGLPRRSLPARLTHAALYRRVDRLVAVSEKSKEYVVKREYAPLSRTRRIYNCARAEFFSAVKPTPSNSRFTALAVGRLVEVKNHATLIRAFADVVKRFPFARLQIAGDGPLRDELRALIETTHVSGSVELLGFRTDVLELLQSCDVFALPSLSEGCSLALAEAMATATPIVASNVGGIPEVAESLGRDSLLDPMDVAQWSRSLSRMIELGAEARQELGQRTRQAALKFAPDSHIAEVQGMYRELLGRA